MPRAILRPCAQAGCSELVERGRCAVHDRRRQLDEHRGSAHSRGYDKRWERARIVYLAEHPTCAHCARHGRVTASAIVDHVIPHRGDRWLFWLQDNWQALCEACHRLKGILESGLQPCTHEIEPVRMVGATGGECASCALCGAVMERAA